MPAGEITLVIHYIVHPFIEYVGQMCIIIRGKGVRKRFTIAVSGRLTPVEHVLTNCSEMLGENGRRVRVNAQNKWNARGLLFRSSK